MSNAVQYDSFDEWMVRRYAELWDHYDRSVLTIAAGGLALSVTFVGEVFTDPEEKWALASGWAGLVVSVLAITGSIFPSILAYERRIKGEDERAKRPGRWAYGLSIVAGVGLAGGFALLGWFAFKNL